MIVETAAATYFPHQNREEAFYAGTIIAVAQSAQRNADAV